MRKYITTLAFVALSHTAIGQQCSWVGLSVSASDSTFCQLYTPGPYLISPRDSNIVTWEISDFQGNIVHRDTTIGNAALMYFNHNVTDADSLIVKALLVNNAAGLMCLNHDTIFWEITEPVPGFSFGNWEFVNVSIAQNVTDVDEMESPLNINLYPSPVASEYLHIEGPLDPYDVTIVNIQGQILGSYIGLSGTEKVDVSHLFSGTYLIKVLHGKAFKTIRFVKQ
jgi:hypothetical protein